MNRKFRVVLSVVASLAALALLVFVLTSGLPAIRAAAEPVLFEVEKIIEPTGPLTVGDEFTVTITISPTAATTLLSSSWPITIYDPNMGPPLGYSGIYSFDETSLTGGAVWDEERRGVMWSTEVDPTDTVKRSVTFCGMIHTVSVGQVITNNIYIEAGAYAGELPGRLPGESPDPDAFTGEGALPGSLPGSIPGENVGDTTVVWAMLEIKPTYYIFLPLVTRAFSGN